MPTNIKIGVAGFSYKEWENIVYPASLKSILNGSLACRNSFIHLVEINLSFYCLIKPTAGRQWCHAVADNPAFVFTAKLYRASPILASRSRRIYIGKDDPVCARMWTIRKPDLMRSRISTNSAWCWPSSHLL